MRGRNRGRGRKGNAQSTILNLFLMQDKYILCVYVHLEAQSIKIQLV